MKKDAKNGNGAKANGNGRLEYQTYPIGRRGGAAAIDDALGSRCTKAAMFATNAESRPSWSLMDELNFVATTPVYKPAVSHISSVALDDQSPLEVPLLLDQGGHGLMVGKQKHRKRLSNAEAVYTIVNIFVGLGMLSKPYSVAQGGWISLFGLSFLCFWGAISGLIMIRCFQLIPGSRVTYPQLGQAAMGIVGKRIVQGIIMLEFVGATLIVMIFMWKNFSFLFPQIDSLTTATTLTIATIPSVWLLNFGELSCISFIGVLANAAITIALIGFIVNDPGQIKAEKYDNVTDMEGLSVAMGIYTVALAGHAALPSIYADIKDKSSINKVVGLSFFFMWIIYCVTAAAGYLFHGRDAHVLVTEDIMIKNPGWCFELVTFLVLAKSYCSVSPIISILNEIPEAGLGITSDWARRTSRTLCLAILSVLAYICQDHLDIVEALTGSAFTMCSSFILPPLFLVLLSYKSKDKEDRELGLVAPAPEDTPCAGAMKANAAQWVSKFTKWDRAYYWFLAISGVVVGAVFTYGDFRELLKKKL
mmetsp:Transcript_30971/g.54317  ORF Transcript_30971/g.54317 Transcript_30971/m.54317 type:complete len:533 (-) Transcript_30971:3-1601(-)